MIDILIPAVVGAISAGAFAWWYGRSSQRKEATRERPDYYAGLNQLLNDQPEQAISTLLAAIEIRDDTVPTHLLMGALLRRLGDADRAIQIHRNILAHPDLSPLRRREGELELARDYLSAGLLGYAEGQLKGVLGQGGAGIDRALIYLLEVYEREREWETALATLESAPVNVPDVSGRSAQYCCELADLAQARGNSVAALELATKAAATDASCVRAHLVRGRLLCDRAAWPEAEVALKSAIELDVRFAREALIELERCYGATARADEFAAFLDQLNARAPCSTAVELRAQHELRRHGAEAAELYLTQQLMRAPSLRNANELVQRRLARDGDNDHLKALNHLLASLLERKPIYRCDDCGFNAQTLHWRCPSCKRWGSTAPVTGAEGE